MRTESADYPLELTPNGKRLIRVGESGGLSLPMQIGALS